MRSGPRALALASLVLAGLLAAPAASAHAVLLSSEPAKGARLDAAPSSVSVTLTEPVETATLQVLDAAGARVDLDDLRTSGGSTPRLTVSLPPGLPDGAYRMQWRATSVDTHTTSGTVGFAVGDFVPPASTDADPQAFPWLGAGGRALAYLGLSLLLGAAVFLAWVPGSAAVPRRPVLEALAAGAALHLLGIGLLAASILRDGSAAGASVWATGLGRALFVRLAAAAAALLFALLALSPRNPARGPAVAAVALGLVAALVGAGFTHAFALAGVAGSAVDAIHLLAAATWAGGLAVFLWLLRDAARGAWAPDQVRLAGVRFGTAALVCVVALAMAGVGATIAILGPDALRPGWVASRWGAVLAAKVALAALMVAVGAVNRYGILEPAASTGFSARVQRALTRRWPGARTLGGQAPALRRLMRLEAALGVATLALAAVLASVSPPTASAAVDGQTEPFEAAGFGADFHGTLTATPWPTVGGSSRLVVHVETHAGRPVEGNTCGREAPLSCVTATIGEGGGETHALQPLGGGDWAADGVLWTSPGQVPVTVTVSTSEVFADELAFAVDVRAAT